MHRGHPTKDLCNGTTQCFIAASLGCNIIFLPKCYGSNTIHFCGIFLAHAPTRLARLLTGTLSCHFLCNRANGSTHSHRISLPSSREVPDALFIHPNGSHFHSGPTATIRLVPFWVEWQNLHWKDPCSESWFHRQHLVPWCLSKCKRSGHADRRVGSPAHECNRGEACLF